MGHVIRWGIGVVVVGAVALLVWSPVSLSTSGGARGPQAEQAPAPVEVEAVRTGVIERRRVFSASLEASARVLVAARAPGRIRTFTPDLGDPIARGETIAVLDTREYEQLVRQARAEVELARAQLAQAEQTAEINRRSLARVRQLNESNDRSDAALDEATLENLAVEAEVDVARARLSGAEASLSARELALENATIRAEWSWGDDRRVLAERYADEGDTVREGDAVASVVEIDPIVAVMFVTETDYAGLTMGQPVTIRTDAYPGELWQGRVARIAPVFREGSRQARVEVEIENIEGRLKPGMFARATVVLDRADGATIVPEASIVRRDGVEGVFVFDDARSTVRFVRVQTGIRDANEIQILGDAVENGSVSGRVVTLGQQLVADGTPVTVANDPVPDGGGE